MRRFSVRAAAAAALLAVPSLAAAAAPPKKLVCQLDGRGLVVEAVFGRKADQPAVSVIRKGAAGAKVTRIAKDDVMAWMDGGALRIAVDREIGGQTKRVLFVTWSGKSASVEALPSAFGQGGDAASIARDDATCVATTVKPRSTVSARASLDDDGI